MLNNNLKSNSLSLLLILVVGIFSLPTLTHSYIERSVGGSIEAVVTPRQPGPGEKVDISIKGYGFNMPGSDIVWLVNNVVQARGRGLDEFSFINGPVGSINSVNAVIKTTDNKYIIKNLVFQPAEVDLLFEVDSYIPNWYQGAALPTRGSTVKVVAMPNIISNSRQLSSEVIDFQWSRNGSPIRTSSGIGKDQLVFTFGDNASENIRLVATVPNTAIEAVSQIRIESVEPELVLYEVKPLSGIDYSQTFSASTDINSDIISIKAEPFYYPKTIVNSVLRYLWQLNGTPLENQGSQITFTKPAETEGEAILQVQTTNPNIPQQSNQIEVKLNLGPSFTSPNSNEF